MPGLGIFLVLLLTALLAAGGIWWGVTLGRPVGPAEADRSPPRTQEVRGPREVGNVLVTLIGEDSSARTVREVRRRGLEAWSMIDPDSGWIEIPIGAAMALVAERTRGRARIGEMAPAQEATSTDTTTAPTDSPAMSDTAAAAVPAADTTGRTP